SRPVAARSRALCALRHRSAGRLRDQHPDRGRPRLVPVGKLDPHARRFRLAVEARRDVPHPARLGARPDVRLHRAQPAALLRQARALLPAAAAVCGPVSGMTVGRVLILGGYGTFGGRLAELLADEPRLTLIIAGRSRTRAEAFCATLKAAATL